MPIRGYASLYHYNIVPVGWGDITDITGQVAQGLTAVVPQKLYMATLDLDRTYTHVSDFCPPKIPAPEGQFRHTGALFDTCLALRT
jgi:hypothetical protein